MWIERKNMNKSEIEISIDTIASLIRESGITSFAGLEARVGKTRAGDDQIEITGLSKKVSLNSGNGLEQIRKGDLKLLIERLATAAAVLPGNIEAPQLLRQSRFKQSCISEISLAENLTVNSFAGEVAGISPQQTPVFYGSTSGINFAEVLETALCARVLQERGLKAAVVFDFDADPSDESSNIFFDSVTALPLPLRERVTRFRQDTEGGLMGGRLKAVRELLGRVEGLPEINLVDGRDVFATLGNRFTLGQLLVLARLAGNDPRLFEDQGRPISARALLSAGNSLEFLTKPVSEFIESGIKPAGFTYYAREAVTGTLGGISGRPLKLTEKANIYKIMLSTTALFDENTGQGTVFFPISRFRIPAGVSGRPVDPIALNVLADENPGKFQDLIRDFRANFQVLTPEQAKIEGTADKRFPVEQYFNSGGNDET